MDFDPRYLTGLRLLRAGHWFAAHEWIEAVWKQAQGPERLGYQALIQLAVALLQLQRRNFWGTLSNLRKVARKLPALGPTVHGVELAAWHAALHEFSERLQVPGRLRRQKAGEAQTDLPAIPPEHTWPQPELARNLEAALGAVRFGQPRAELLESG